MQSVNIISAKGLCFQYNSTEVLTDVSFDLEKGEYLGIVGPNGSGKTTLTRLILGFLKPSKGSISVFDTNPSQFTEWHRVGYLPQKNSSSGSHFPATVKEIVALGLLSKKRSPKKIDRYDLMSIDKSLDSMGILNIKDELIGELSGGQLQRVLIAKAMVNEPDLLILDEPTTAIDPEIRERFFDILNKLNRENHLTIIIVTHDIGTIGRYASRLLYLDKKVIFFGSFESFCTSSDMTDYFGEFSQHIICHRHDNVKK